MAFDEGLAHRVREFIQDQPYLVEKKMFGGVGFMLQGNMATGIYKNDLIVRVGPDRYEEAVKEPHVKEFDITGRPMKGWIMVSPEGTEDDQDLADWVGQGIDFALSLPPK
jgi:TfoX/Sxy family transcriptional regulator of competence genes